MKKIKARNLLIGFFALLAIGGGIFYFVKYFHFGADPLGDVLMNQAIITYKDQNQKNVTFTASAQTQKVHIPLLAVGPNFNKRRAVGKITLNDAKNKTIDELALNFNQENQVAIDWTGIDSINPNKKYNLVLKLPGYLAERLNAVNLNSAATFNVTQLIAGNAYADKTIDLRDFSVLMSSWGKSNVNADFNGDKTVNILDFSILMASWGKSEK